MNKSILKAIEKLYSIIGDRDILNDIKTDILTENTCRNGRAVLWYLTENTDVAIYIDTLELLTETEKEKELF
ncbi:MAG: hypothetical protein K6D96_01725 [Acetatifactor sp.]|nr:hypothetical protein [Acetatifactor sp.]